ncbi:MULTISPECIES: TniB family NTP-binding protein [unclassified Mesorhizobium]|uniref:TniB family NTP-binding protein n=1 Tax=unclassified Mesorhizobium TaxID=325217 RepID=UPI00333ABC41
MSAVPSEVRFHTTKFDTDEERGTAAALPAAQRQWMVENLLFEYPLFKEVSSEVARFHHPVVGGTHGTGAIGGVIGASRSGKSYICKHYAADYPVQVLEEGEKYPVVYLEARGDWTPYHFAEQVFMATGAKSVPSMKTPALITASQRRLLKVGTELVIIDDSHFLLLETKGRVQATFKSLVKGIADIGSCNVLLAGLPGLQAFIEGADQLNGSGDFPHWETKPLRWEIEDEREQFMLLLHGIDRRLPFLKLSGLANPSKAADFYHGSEGKIGRVMNIIADAALRAINDGTACIMMEHLQAAAIIRMKVGETYRPFYDNRSGESA